MAVAISFFSGAGGLDVGIKKAGFKIKLTVEIENTYCETLRLNHPKMNIIQGDIMEYNKLKIYNDAKMKASEEVDLLFGGSPCQSFSTAGNRQGFEDSRGQAMLKFAELVREVKPKVFLLENVRGLLSAALKHRPLDQRGDGFPPLEPGEMQGSALQYLLKQFKGYKVKHKTLNAADYGVTQTRERVFFVGVRNDIKLKYNFPKGEYDSKGKDGLKKWIPLKTLLKKLKVNEHHYPEYTPERLEYMKKIPIGGGNWKDLPLSIRKEAMGGAFNSGGGKVGFYRRLWIDRPAPTMLTSPTQKSTNLGHPYENRPLSIEEYLAIQGFPLDYKIAGTLSDKYIQIGNAVPIKLATTMGKSIWEFLKQVELNHQKKSAN